MTEATSGKIKEFSPSNSNERFGNTEEVADVAVFLATQELTGQVIAIDGGLTMQ